LNAINAEEIRILDPCYLWLVFLFYLFERPLVLLEFLTGFAEFALPRLGAGSPQIPGWPGSRAVVDLLSVVWGC
jgi:hypothetical protein